MSIEKILSDSDIKDLRDKGVLQECEVAIQVGDIVVAENVLTKSRRVLDAGSIISESKRKILKG
tara:strand:- start:5406 stop:5597 length:192 start_codon:yes stop_codon:yes gene_type:complete